MRTPLTGRLARASARRPWLTIGLWAAALAVALPLAGQAEGAVTLEVRAIADLPAMGPPRGLVVCNPPYDARLAADPALRRTIGDANRTLARSTYDEAAMIAAYRALYARAMRRADFP